MKRYMAIGYYKAKAGNNDQSDTIYVSDTESLNDFKKQLIKDNFVAYVTITQKGMKKLVAAKGDIDVIREVIKGFLRSYAYEDYITQLFQYLTPQLKYAFDHGWFEGTKESSAND